MVKLIKTFLFLFWPLIAIVVVLFVYVKIKKIQLPMDEEIDKYDYK